MHCRTFNHLINLSECPWLSFVDIELTQGSDDCVPREIRVEMKLASGVVMLIVRVDKGTYR